jgi:hypothetical protein
METDLFTIRVYGQEKRVADFWSEKIPCWELLGCTDQVYSDAKPIETGSGPAGRLPGLDAGRYSISNGNAGIAASLCFTVIMLNEANRQAS